MNELMASTSSKHLRILDKNYSLQDAMPSIQAMHDL